MRGGKLHYGWVVIFMGLLTTIAAHGFGRMAYTIILPAMKDGLKFDYTQLGLLGTGNFIGYLIMAITGGFLAARSGTRIVIRPGASQPSWPLLQETLWGLGWRLPAWASSRSFLESAKLWARPSEDTWRTSATPLRSLSS